MQIRPILAAPVLFFAVAALLTQAQARDRFAMTCIENKTNLNLRYKVKWGSGTSWEPHRISSQGTGRPIHMISEARERTRHFT